MIRAPPRTSANTRNRARQYRRGYHEVATPLAATHCTPLDPTGKSTEPPPEEQLGRGQVYRH